MKKKYRLMTKTEFEEKFGEYTILNGLIYNVSMFTDEPLLFEVDLDECRDEEGDIIISRIPEFDHSLISKTKNYIIDDVLIEIIEKPKKKSNKGKILGGVGLLGIIGLLWKFKFKK